MREPGNGTGEIVKKRCIFVRRNFVGRNFVGVKLVVSPSTRRGT